MSQSESDLADRLAIRREGIVANCALGEECTCIDAAKPWLCPNWGRSTLAAPRLGHVESHYTGMSRDEVSRRIDERKRKHDNWKGETDKRLREVRHADPVKHLAKKGVTVKR